MNVFILNTGRCGSTTFIKACEHISNYSCAHESRTGLLGDSHFDYPNNHIEADNRLAWLLGRLDKRYGDNAFYVHLKRDEIATARSFVNRYSTGIIKAYRSDGILLDLPGNSDPMAVSIDYCNTVNSNIELFLRDKSRKIEVSLETIDFDFERFWEFIGAEGDIESALAEFNVTYNSTEKNRLEAQKSLRQRTVKKAVRLIAKLSGYLNNG